MYFFIERNLLLTLQNVPPCDAAGTLTVDDGIIFLCMSDESMKRRLTFAFLEDVKKQWREKYSTVEQTALAFSLNDLFAPILQQKIVRAVASCHRPGFLENYFLAVTLILHNLRTQQEFYSSNPSADNISRVQAQIDTGQYRFYFVTGSSKLDCDKPNLNLCSHS